MRTNLLYLLFSDGFCLGLISQYNEVEESLRSDLAEENPDELEVLFEMPPLLAPPAHPPLPINNHIEKIKYL